MKNGDTGRPAYHLFLEETPKEEGRQGIPAPVEKAVAAKAVWMMAEGIGLSSAASISMDVAGTSWSELV